MRLTFGKLIIQDFKGFHGKHVLDLSDLGKGLHFIRGVNEVEVGVGSNGSGKSTLWDALCWCLYGKSLRGLKNPDVKPWRVKKPKPRVALYFRTDGDRHKIVRTIKPNTLTIDGRDAGQDEVERLIGLSYDVMVNTILLGQECEFFLDMKPQAKMRLLSDCLDLERWESRSKLAATKVSILEEKLAEADYEIRKDEELLGQLDDQIGEAQKRFKGWSEDRRGRLKAAQDELSGCESTLRVVEAELHKADGQYDVATMERRAVGRDIGKIRTEISELESAVSRYRQDIKQRKSIIVRIKTELASVDEGAECLSCGQDLPHSSVVKLTNELNAELKRERKLLASRRDVLVRFKVGLSEKRKKLSGLADAEHEFTVKAEKAQDRADNFRPRVAELKARINAAAKSVTELEQQDNPYQDELYRLKKQRRKINARIDENDERVEKLEKLITRTKYWVGGFKEVRLHILEEFLEELGVATTAILDEMSLTGWGVAYRIEKESRSGRVQRGLTVAISAPGAPQAVKWESWSGGEGQRIQLASTMALSEVLLARSGIRPNLEVLDEPTQHLSPEGVEDVCDYLADRARTMDRQIFYVDHQTVESSRFSSVLTVVRDGDGSRIEYD